MRLNAVSKAAPLPLLGELSRALLRAGLRGCFRRSVAGEENRHPSAGTRKRAIAADRTLKGALVALDTLARRAGSGFESRPYERRLPGVRLVAIAPCRRRLADETTEGAVERGL